MLIHQVSLRRGTCGQPLLLSLQSPLLLQMMLLLEGNVVIKN